MSHSGANPRFVKWAGTGPGSVGSADHQRVTGPWGRVPSEWGSVQSPWWEARVQRPSRSWQPFCQCSHERRISMIACPCIQGRLLLAAITSPNLLSMSSSRLPVPMPGTAPCLSDTLTGCNSAAFDSVNILGLFLSVWRFIFLYLITPLNWTYSNADHCQRRRRAPTKTAGRTHVRLMRLPGSPWFNCQLFDGKFTELVNEWMNEWMNDWQVNESVNVTLILAEITRNYAMASRLTPCTVFLHVCRSV